MISRIKQILREIIDFGLLLIAIAIILEVLFGPSSPFLGKGITDNGSKYERLRFIQNQYIQKAKGKFELEKKDYLFVDNEKLTLKKAIANNKANSETISRNRGNNQNIKLKPIITFGQNQ